MTEEEIGKMNEEADEERVRTTETLTTTAPQGASAEEIRAGIQDAKQAREAAIAASEKEKEKVQEERQKQMENQGQDEVSSSSPAPPSPPARTKSRFSIFGRLSTTPVSPTKIEPYPGT